VVEICDQLHNQLDCGSTPDDGEGYEERMDRKGRYKIYIYEHYYIVLLRNTIVPRSLYLYCSVKNNNIVFYQLIEHPR